MEDAVVKLFFLFILVIAGGVLWLAYRALAWVVSRESEREPERRIEEERKQETDRLIQMLRQEAVKQDIEHHSIGSFATSLRIQFSGDRQLQLLALVVQLMNKLNKSGAEPLDVEEATQILRRAVEIRASGMDFEVRYQPSQFSKSYVANGYTGDGQYEEINTLIAPQKLELLALPSQEL